MLYQHFNIWIVKVSFLKYAFKYFIRLYFFQYFIIEKVEKLFWLKETICSVLYIAITSSISFDLRSFPAKFLLIYIQWSKRLKQKFYDCSIKYLYFRKEHILYGLKAMIQKYFIQINIDLNIRLEFFLFLSILNRKFKNKMKT